MVWAHVQKSPMDLRGILTLTRRPWKTQTEPRLNWHLRKPQTRIPPSRLRLKTQTLPRSFNPRATNVKHTSPGSSRLSCASSPVLAERLALTCDVLSHGQPGFNSFSFFGYSMLWDLIVGCLLANGLGLWLLPTSSGTESCTTFDRENR